jgi:hypothetical protein
MNCKTTYVIKGWILNEPFVTCDHVCKDVVTLWVRPHEDNITLFRVKLNLAIEEMPTLFTKVFTSDYSLELTRSDLIALQTVNRCLYPVF